MELLEKLSTNVYIDFIDPIKLNQLKNKIDLRDLLFNGTIIKTNWHSQEIEKSFTNPFINTLMKAGK